MLDIVDVFSTRLDNFGYWIDMRYPYIAFDSERGGRYTIAPSRVYEATIGIEYTWGTTCVIHTHNSRYAACGRVSETIPSATQLARLPASKKENVHKGFHSAELTH